LVALLDNIDIIADAADADADDDVASFAIPSP
jgi:hypothetical protein